MEREVLQIWTQTDCFCQESVDCISQGAGIRRGSELHLVTDIDPHFDFVQELLIVEKTYL
jgi:hypothetical protein